MKRLTALLLILVLSLSLCACEEKKTPEPEEAKLSLSLSGLVTEYADGCARLCPDEESVGTVVILPEKLNEENESFGYGDYVEAACWYRESRPDFIYVESYTRDPAVLIEESYRGTVVSVDLPFLNLQLEDSEETVRLDLSGIDEMPEDLAEEDVLDVDVQYWNYRVSLPLPVVSLTRDETPGYQEFPENPNALKDGQYTSKGFLVRVIDGVTYIDGTLIANKTYRLPASYNPGGLTRECSNAFSAMKSGAAEDGISLKIVSGFRDYDTQYVIYWRYVSNDGQAEADTYSARPGHSEHQTGLAMDINSLKSSWGDTQEGIWLKEHCHEYGFIIRYPKGKDGITGYIYEPWHARYVGVELATKLYESGLTLEEYFGIDSVYYEG